MVIAEVYRPFSSCREEEWKKEGKKIGGQTSVTWRGKSRGLSALYWYMLIRASDASKADVDIAALYLRR